MKKYQNIDQIKELKPKTYKNIGETRLITGLDEALMQMVVISLIASILRDILEKSK
jgi:hypothetical protein